jgi:pyridoxamine 5'-phosphate oxidase
MTNKMDLSDVRRNYESQSISKDDLDGNPLVQFGNWMKQARELDLLDATAMTLATTTIDGQPSARIVLLKQFDEDGFCWYTDSRSQKGQELAANPRAALLIHWRDLSRQVRIQGLVEQLSAESADLYFVSRPEGSRFSAASSHQSSEVENRAVLENEVERLHGIYPDGNLPRPDTWIGYRLRPNNFEFWQGQVNRLHDRIVYTRAGDGWQMKRISP